MRAAAILGLGSSEKLLRLFHKASSADWTLGVPLTPSSAEAILLFGGDGTIHRHLKVLVQLGLPVLIVPCGSGNDFANSIGIPSPVHALAAWQKFLQRKDNLRQIDLGVIRPLHKQIPGSTSTDTADDSAPSQHSRNSKPETQNSFYFCCAGGAGLDASIARAANQIPRWLRGNGGYVLSLLAALVSYRPIQTKIFIPQSQAWELKLDSPAFAAVFANTPRYGGGMQIAPRAQLDDGLLDICTVSGLSKTKVLRFFPKVFSGRHLEIPEVAYFQTARLRVETEIPQDVYADGEFVCRTPIEVSAAPRALRIIRP